MTCAWCGSIGDDGCGCEHCEDKGGRKLSQRDYIEIGSSPYGESCAQVGSEHYARLSSIECQVYAAQLKRMFPDGEFGVKSFAHDFGSYKEVVAYFYPDSEDAMMEAAFEAERSGPEFWDEEAKAAILELCTKYEVPAPTFMGDDVVTFDGLGYLRSE